MAVRWAPTCVPRTLPLPGCSLSIFWERLGREAGKNCFLGLDPNWNLGPLLGKQCLLTVKRSPESRAAWQIPESHKPRLEAPPTTYRIRAGKGPFKASSASPRSFLPAEFMFHLALNLAVALIPRSLLDPRTGPDLCSSGLLHLSLFLPALEERTDEGVARTGSGGVLASMRRAPRDGSGEQSLGVFTSNFGWNLWDVWRALGQQTACWIEGATPSFLSNLLGSLIPGLNLSPWAEVPSSPHLPRGCPTSWLSSEGAPAFKVSFSLASWLCVLYSMLWTWGTPDPPQHQNLSSFQPLT